MLSAFTSIILRIQELILLQWECHLRVHLNWIIMKWKLYTFSETKFKKPLSSWERFWTQSSCSPLAVVYIAVNEPVLISFSYYHKLFGVIVPICITLCINLIHVQILHPLMFSSCWAWMRKTMITMPVQDKLGAKLEQVLYQLAWDCVHRSWTNNINLQVYDCWPMREM